MEDKRKYKKKKYQNSFKGALQHDKRILTTVASGKPLGYLPAR